MDYETGIVNEELEALVKLRLLNGATIECQVDTGFSGTVLLPRALVQAYGFPFTGEEEIRTISVKTEWAQVAAAGIHWLGDEFDVRVIVGETNFALIGAELLVDARLTIDYAAGSVVIEKMR